jgi:hypothetical protein
VSHATIITVKINVMDWCWVKDLCRMGAASPKSFNIDDLGVTYSLEYAPCFRMYDAGMARKCDVLTSIRLQVFVYLQLFVPTSIV